MCLICSRFVADHECMRQQKLQLRVWKDGNGSREGSDERNNISRHTAKQSNRLRHFMLLSTVWRVCLQAYAIKNGLETWIESGTWQALCVCVPILPRCWKQIAVGSRFAPSSCQATPGLSLDAMPTMLLAPPLPKEHKSQELYVWWHDVAWLCSHKDIKIYRCLKL